MNVTALFREHAYVKDKNYLEHFYH